jgi:hypothetical protein
VQVEGSPSDARKEQPRIKPWREAVERLRGSQRQRHGPERASLLPVELRLSVRVDATDVDDASLPVNVAPLEGEPFLRAKAREADEQWKRHSLGGELVRDGLWLGDRAEGGNLSPLWLRVGDEAGDVLIEQLRPDGVVQDLPQRLRDRPGRASWKLPPPRSDFRHRQPVGPKVLPGRPARRASAPRSHSEGELSRCGSCSPRRCAGRRTRPRVGRGLASDGDVGRTGRPAEAQ